MLCVFLFIASVFLNNVQILPSLVNGDFFKLAFFIFFNLTLEDFHNFIAARMTSPSRLVLQT